MAVVLTSVCASVEIACGSYTIGDALHSVWAVLPGR